jgi:hypothetical protein
LHKFLKDYKDSASRRDHFFGVLPRRIGDFLACEHSGDFFDLFVFAQAPDRNFRPIFRRLFVDEIMLVGKRRDLRLVRDAQNLLRFGEFF